MSRVTRFLIFYVIALVGFYFIGAFFGAGLTLLDPHALVLQLYYDVTGQITIEPLPYFYFQDQLDPHGTWVALMIFVFVPALLTAIILKIRDRLMGRRHFDIVG